MLLVEDVQDDLIEEYPQYSRSRDGILIYQNGRGNPRYIVDINVRFIGEGE